MIPVDSHMQFSPSCVEKGHQRQPQVPVLQLLTPESRLLFSDAKKV
jgi:hypothetical protein